MIYPQQTPSSPLRSLVGSLWYCRAPHVSHSRERVLLNGCMPIVFSLSRNYLTDCGKDGTENLRLPHAIISGAKIITALETKEYGGKAFTCSDPEGHLWFFGTYDPWESHQA
jgi:hypothetical protein